MKNEEQGPPAPPCALWPAAWAWGRVLQPLDVSLGRVAGRPGCSCLGWGRPRGGSEERPPGSRAWRWEGKTWGKLVTPTPMGVPWLPPAMSR